MADVYHSYIRSRQIFGHCHENNTGVGWGGRGKKRKVTVSGMGTNCEQAQCKVI